MTWGCVVHIVPLDDLRDHDENIDCWCCPRVEEEGAGLMVIHNAMDGREKYETGEQRLH